MTETILYLLKSKFPDPEHGDQLLFCGQCSPIEGLIAMFPDVRQNLDVRYADKADLALYKFGTSVRAFGGASLF